MQHTQKIQQRNTTNPEEKKNRRISTISQKQEYPEEKITTKECPQSQRNRTYPEEKRKNVEDLKEIQQTQKTQPMESRSKHERRVK